MMMGNWNFIFPYATNLIVELCTDQEGSGTKLCTGQEGSGTKMCTGQEVSGTKHIMESNATSQDGYTGSWSNEFWPHEKSKHQDPTDDEWDVEEDEWEPVQHYDEWDIEDEDWEQVDHQFPPTATKEEDDQMDELASEDECIPTAMTEQPPPKKVTEHQEKTIKYLATLEPDQPLPAPGASDTIQDNTEVQDRARPRIKRKTYRPNVKEKDVEHLLATTKGDHQMVTSKGGQVYRGKPGRLKGCAGILQDVQPAGLLRIGDVFLAIGVMGVG